jgi:hypothetical protein
VIVTLALPDLETSSALVAATVTEAGEGGAGGAVYVAVAAPVFAIVPIVKLPPAIPFTLQETAVPVAPKTVAVNTCAPPRWHTRSWGRDGNRDAAFQAHGR